MVEARPSALLDSTHQVASGLPSMTHDGSIGRGVRSTVNLAISINSRDIKNLWRPEAFGNGDLHANGRALSFPYELHRNRRKRAQFCVRRSRASRPLTLAEHRDAAAVGINAIDVGRL